MIRVMVVASRNEVREGLCTLLRLADDIEITGAAASHSSAIEQAGSTSPDVALVDLEMPGGEGCSVIGQLKRLYPHMKSIAITAHDYPAARESAIQAGADQVIVKGLGVVEMVAAIQRTAVKRTTINQPNFTESAMEKISRETFQSRLRNDWQNYIERFRRLTPAGQQAFLEIQGYARLGDLLGHIIAWWQDGAQEIAQMRANRAYSLKEYDVDAFNALAVERFRPYSDDEVIQAFTSQQQVMLALVSSLSEKELEQENINTRLYYEIIMHWSEHELQNLI